MAFTVAELHVISDQCKRLHNFHTVGANCDCRECADGPTSNLIDVDRAGDQANENDP
jgi:hypothetical protein